MKGKFVKYRSFNGKPLATELYQKLAEASIPVLLGKIFLAAGIALVLFILLQYYAGIEFMRPL